MSETQVGILTGLPPVLFACAAVLGSLLIARFGALATLVAGLLVTAAGSALRGARARRDSALRRDDRHRLRRRDHAPLIAAAGAHLAAAPHRLRDGGVHQRTAGGRDPSRRADHSGGAAAAGESWRASFVVWAIPVAVIALVILGLAPRSCARAITARRQRWWPDWKDPLIWRLGIALGSVNAMYFSANAFLPDYLHHVGRPDLVSAALTALNLGQIPASFLLLAVAGRLERAIWPHVVCGAGSLAAIVGIATLPGPGIVACAGGARLLRRRDPHPDAGAAAAAGPAGGRTSRLGRDVHDQLLVRGDHAGIQRVAVGSDAGSPGRLSCRSAHARSC